eukprot:666381-Prorocentrum_minimum.AAC.1
MAADTADDKRETRDSSKSSLIDSLGWLCSADGLESISKLSGSPFPLFEPLSRTRRVLSHCLFFIAASQLSVPTVRQASPAGGLVPVVPPASGGGGGAFLAVPAGAAAGAAALILSVLAAVVVKRRRAARLASPKVRDTPGSLT